MTNSTTTMPPQIKQAKLREEFEKLTTSLSPEMRNAIADWWLPKLSQAKLETLEAIIKEVEGKKKTNCGCPPFHPNHNGPCDDKDHSELNSALSDLLTKLQAEKELIEVQECKDGKCIVGNLGRCIICNKK